MRALLTPVGSAGDNLPFIGIGAELARRGHEVALAGNEHFQADARRAGLGFVSVGTEAEFRKAIEDPDLWHPLRGFQTAMRLVCEQNRRIFEVVRGQGADVVVSPTLDFASGIVQEKTGLPVVRVHLQPAVMRSEHRISTMSGTMNFSWLPRVVKRVSWWGIDRWMTDPVALPMVNELRARLGLGPARRLFQDHIHSPRLTVGMWPEWYAPVQADWPRSLRLAGFPLYDAPGEEPPSAEVEAFLAAGEPPVVFTPGSAMVHGRSFFETAIAALQRLGRRGMLLTRHGEQVPASRPDGVEWFPYAPLSRILSRCAALVHHGGIGTTAAALAEGCPQVIMPMSHDQPDNAYRVMGLGVGMRIMPKRFNVKRLGRALASVLKVDVKQRCAEVAGRCESGIPEAAGWIEAEVRSAGGCR